MNTISLVTPMSERLAGFTRILATVGVVVLTGSVTYGLGHASAAAPRAAAAASAFPGTQPGAGDTSVPPLAASATDASADEGPSTF